MKIICPKCKQVLHGTEKSLGHKARCPKCEATFRVIAEHCPNPTPKTPDNPHNRHQAGVSDLIVSQPTPPTDSLSEKDVDSGNEKQTRWAMAISAAGLACVATLLITVFTLRGSSSNKPEIATVKQERTLPANKSTISKVNAPRQETNSFQKMLKNPSAKTNSQTELNTADLIEKVDPSICKIESGLSSGTGFLVASGIVATNAHVVDSWGELNCYFPGNYDSSKAQIIWFNPDIDIAFLSVPIERPPLEITNSDDVKRGEKVIAIGYPGTVGNSVSSSVTTGILSNRTNIEGIFYHQTDAAINSGNSGGPVFDKFGKVIGIATLKEINKENIGYVLPVSYIFSEYADMYKSTPQERFSKLARYVRNSDIKAIKGGNALVLLMLTDIESAWSDAIKYENNFQRAVLIVSEKHGHLAEFTSARLNEIDANIALYKHLLTERQTRAMISAKYIVIEACNFVKSPSGSYLRFEQYWPAKISQLQEEIRILESTTD